MRIAAMVLENLTPELPSQQPSLQLLLAYINEETVARAMAACQPDDPCRWHLLLPVLRIATCVIRMHSYAQQGVDAEEGSWLPRLLDLFVEACECDSVLRRQVFSTLSALVLALDQQVRRMLMFSMFPLRIAFLTVLHYVILLIHQRMGWWRCC